MLLVVLVAAGALVVLVGLVLVAGILVVVVVDVVVVVGLVVVVSLVVVVGRGVVVGLVVVVVVLLTVVNGLVVVVVVVDVKVGRVLTGTAGTGTITSFSLSDKKAFSTLRTSTSSPRSTKGLIWPSPSLVRPFSGGPRGSLRIARGSSVNGGTDSSRSSSTIRLAVTGG